jgi:hypothetical protein
LSVDAFSCQYGLLPAALDALISGGTLNRRPSSDLLEWGLHEFVEVAAQIKLIVLTGAKKAVPTGNRHGDGHVAAIRTPGIDKNRGPAVPEEIYCLQLEFVKDVGTLTATCEPAKKGRQNIMEIPAPYCLI